MSGGHKNNHAMFEAAQERSLQVALHAWGRAGRSLTSSGFTTTYLEDYLANQPIAQAQMLSFVSEGVFERFPDLRVMVTECDFAWLPTLLWRFDKDWKGVWREVPWVKDLPSEYVHRHFCLTTAPAHLPPDDAGRAQLLEMLGGPAMLAYASDFPTITATASRHCWINCQPRTAPGSSRTPLPGSTAWARFERIHLLDTSLTRCKTGRVCN
jgi:predicted TIM-barrel fold metal-dependent hydrolase